MDPQIQAFAIDLTKTIILYVEDIVRVYKEDSEEGFSAYLDFVKNMKPSLEKIILEGLGDPLEAGRISPRLLKDPLDTGLMIKGGSSIEKEAQVVGYLQAILQLVYCGAKGLEWWQFSSSSLYQESLKNQGIGKITVLLPLIQLIKQEIIDLSPQIKVNSTKKTKNAYIPQSELKQEFEYLYQSTDDENTGVPFTARLMAYYRAQENLRDSPLIIDPYAERLAGDMTSYAAKHKFITSRGDYPLVRSYYIENNLLIPWCNTKRKSQIVLLGAGLDTRAYRFEPLQTNTHTFFEIDFSSVIQYKEEILDDDQPLCDLIRISADISNHKWTYDLLESGFVCDLPSFWILEGLVYYLEQDEVTSILKKIATKSTEDSQIFVDLCVPAIAGLVWGPFTRYFKWGLDKKAIPDFFASTGWNVSCSFADNYDQGRDVGQRGLIFVHGVRGVFLQDS